MNDKTILKPRPGGRGGAQPFKPSAAVSPSSSGIPEDDRTILSKVGGLGEYKELPSLSVSDNPLVDEAGTLFFLIAKMRNSAKQDNVGKLKQNCVELIKTYEQSLRIRHVEPRLIDAARYCMCSFVDETVLNTTWGEQSEWGAESLLSLFHKETTGGEYFYTQIEVALSTPGENLKLLELQHLCLSLGFTGKMRIEDRGSEKLEVIREKVFRAIRMQRGDYERELSPGWMTAVVHQQDVKSGVPYWVVFSVLGAVLLMAYTLFSYKINEYSDFVYLQLSELTPWKYSGSSPVTQQVRVQSVQLQQFLQTEIQRDLLSVSNLPDRIRIRIGANQLFEPGRVRINDVFEPVISKIARSLESTKGKVLVTGYTDNGKVFSSKYPSNWHLSLARANAISDMLSQKAALQGRLWPEGKGETDPIAPNDTEINRSLNRRIEIDLLQ